MGLTKKKELFCHAYVANNFNAEATAREIYGEEGKSLTSIYRWLKEPEVQERIAELLRERLEPLMINEDRVTLELASIAFAAKGDADYNATAKLKALDILSKQLGMQTTKVEADVATTIRVSLED